MKRFCLCLAGLCVLLALACGCVAGDIEDLYPDNDTDNLSGGGKPDDYDDVDDDDYDDDDDDEDGDGILRLQINELRTESNLGSKAAEYIEFKIISGGNMEGVKVIVPANKNPVLYEFLPLKVKQGGYLVLHLRTLDDACRDEYGRDLEKSGGRDSSPTARDFWIPGSTKLLHKTEIVYVLDKDGAVLDAVIMDDGTGKEWKNTLKDAAEFLFEQGAWQSADGGIPGPADAVNTSAVKSAITRSVSRDESMENTNSAADWFVADRSVTPGKPNVARN